MSEPHTKIPKWVQWHRDISDIIEQVQQAPTPVSNEILHDVHYLASPLCVFEELDPRNVALLNAVKSKLDAHYGREGAGNE